MPDGNCKKEYIRRINQVQDYIEGHLDQSLSLEELSNAAGFSKFHFSRIFQSILHEPLAHYVNRIRMENALFLLAHRTDKNMTDIAYELGFTDSAIFSRAFRNYYGVSPREYRKEYSKNCKDSFLLSEYNRDTAKKEAENHRTSVAGTINVVTLKEQQAVYVRHTGTYETLAKEYAKLMDSLFEHAMKQQLLIEDKNWLLSIYHDNPEFGTDEQFRTSLCLTVPDEITAKGDDVLNTMKLEGGLYAVGHFQIHQEQYADIWDFMYREWLSCSGYVPRNASPFEVYRNDASKEKDHIHKVDIYVPIEPITF